MASTDDPRAKLVAEIEAQIGPLPEAYRRAYLSVDRERFVREVDRPHAWKNVPLPLDTSHGSPIAFVDELVARYGSYQAAIFSPAVSQAAATISAPGIYALSFRLLALAPGDSWLELGSGTGYGAALAAEIVGPTGSVTTVDVDPELVQAAQERLAPWPNVRVVHADGLARPDLVALHDRVYLAFAVDSVPRVLLDALREGASLIAPVRNRHPGSLFGGGFHVRSEEGESDRAPSQPSSPPQAFAQTVVRYRREAGQLLSEPTMPVMYIGARSFIPA